MPAMRRAICALATASLCLVPVSCADDRPSGEQHPAPANAGAGSGLGPQRFAVIDALYVALLAVDAPDGGSAVAEIRRAARSAAAACDALDADDPLLGALRRPCPHVVRLAGQLGDIEGCATAIASRCLGVVGVTQNILAGLIRLSHRADRAIERSALTRACERALVTPALAYEVFAAFAGGLQVLERGFETGSRAEVARGNAMLEESGVKGGGLPSARQSLDRFRRDCA